MTDKILVIDYDFYIAEEALIVEDEICRVWVECLVINAYECGEPRGNKISIPGGAIPGSDLPRALILWKVIVLNRKNTSE